MCENYWSVCILLIYYFIFTFQAETRCPGRCLAKSENIPLGIGFLTSTWSPTSSVPLRHERVLSLKLEISISLKHHLAAICWRKCIQKSSQCYLECRSVSILPTLFLFTLHYFTNIMSTPPGQHIILPAFALERLNINYR